MITLSSLSSKQLKRAAEIQERIEALHLELAALLGKPAPAVATAVIEEAPEAAKAGRKAGRRGGRRNFTAEGLARIRAGQARRWAKVRAEKEKKAKAGRKG